MVRGAYKPVGLYEQPWLVRAALACTRSRSLGLYEERTRSLGLYEEPWLVRGHYNEPWLYAEPWLVRGAYEEPWLVTGAPEGSLGLYEESTRSFGCTRGLGLYEERRLV